MTGIVVRSLLDAWAVLLPVSCAGCGAEDRGLCPTCRAELRPRPTVHRLDDGTAVVTALEYRGAARRAILALKEQGRTDVARPLSAPLAAAVIGAARMSAAPVELAAVPTSRASYRRRGYDPVALLLRRAGFPTPERVLSHRRQPAHQKALDRESRRINLEGSMVAKRRLGGRRFVVVDDVTTTGATLTEAVRAIRAAGGEVVATATIAHTIKLFATRGSCF